MIKDIRYKGYSANPSDYDCSEGDLAMSLGLIPEDGSLRPILPPSVVLELSSGEAVKYIHKVSGLNLYIILDSSNILAWRSASSSTRTTLREFSSTIHQINAIGNTLVVLASDGMHYFLWKGISDGYMYLGTEIPECPISFGLLGKMEKGDEFTISFSTILGPAIWSELSEDNKITITNQVLPKVNQFIAEKSTNQGKFMFPFFIRYAYRLYDGSLTKHSAPVLMVASSHIAPVVYSKTEVGMMGAGELSSITLEIASMLHSIDYTVVDAEQLTLLKGWKDIVSSVDIFISAPIYTYDQNGKCPYFSMPESSPFCVCKHTNQATSTTTYPPRYQSHFFHNLYASTFNPETLDYPTALLALPQKSSNDGKSGVKNSSLFYFLDSIKIDALNTDRTDIVVEDGCLQSLTSREVMTDDYDSHDKMLPRYSFSYNNRLNITNISKVLFAGQNAMSLFGYTDGCVSCNKLDDTPMSADGLFLIEAFVYIREAGKVIIAHGDVGTAGKPHSTSLSFFYYPNPNAYKALIKSTDPLGVVKYFELPLERHSFLNGAFYFKEWDGGIGSADASTPTASTEIERTIDIQNKIYTSEVNNPYYFPVLGINTVGTGDIIGISSAAKALSQGQFGQFPLYAFTTEGIWALEVSNTGSYSARQPITRDVCISPDSITQIDSAVLFTTDRGIMLISGSEVKCISDALKSDDIFTIADLPNASALMDIYNDKANDTEQITLANITLMPFVDFLTNCQMSYDYINQRIIVYNANVKYAYVYSMKTGMWGMMVSNIVDGVNSHPESLVMTSNAQLVDLSKSTAESVVALAITRPFSLDDDLDLLKTIDTIIQHGYFQPSHVSQVLYGSNDLYNWSVVWSSSDKYLRGFRGSPYKFFRLVIFCDFGKGESLSKCSIQYKPRMTNRPR